LLRERGSPSRAIPTTLRTGLSRFRWARRKRKGTEYRETKGNTFVLGPIPDTNDGRNAS
jgi:hypothetical protein